MYYCSVFRSFDVTSPGSRSRDDGAACSLAGGRGPGRRLYRSDSLPVGGTAEEAARARARVHIIPRVAMARFNDDGTPRSILKKTSSISDNIQHY